MSFSLHGVLDSNSQDSRQEKSPRVSPRASLLRCGIVSGSGLNLTRVLGRNRGGLRRAGLVRGRVGPLGIVAECADDLGHIRRRKADEEPELANVVHRLADDRTVFRPLHEEADRVLFGRDSVVSRRKSVHRVTSDPAEFQCRFARFDDGEITYAKASWKPSADASEWPRARLWRGLACENVTQASANDILRHSLAQLEREGHDVVLHVHDEIVLETANPNAAEELKRVMCTAPAWADGLPLSAEVETMKRYGK